MLVITDSASEELKKVFDFEPNKKNNLIIFFQGFG